jgi:rSAM-associated Gly-rich repeat protein
MADNRRSFRTVAKLLPTGMLGLSIGLAAAGAKAATSTGPVTEPDSVAAKLKEIRSSVSALQMAPPQEVLDDPVQLAWWPNGYWHRGWPNWHNWHNGVGPVWGNGGWGNGGWPNWVNGWHNGWHNW